MKEIYENIIIQVCNWILYDLPYSVICKMLQTIGYTVGQCFLIIKAAEILPQEIEIKNRFGETIHV